MSKIAIYFPGIGYTADKPLLYYGRKAAYEAGFHEYRNVTYIYTRKDNLRGNDEKMKEVYESLFPQAESQLTDIDWNAYDDVLFVSKSIGTIVAASYAKQYELKQVSHILYTPLARTFDYTLKEAIGFIGTADPWSNVDEIIKLSEKAGIPLNIYDNCNHSLECDDTFRNLEVLRDVMEKTFSFCRKSSCI